ENAASRPTLARLMQMVRQAEAAGQILEAGEFGGGSYVVTDPIDKFTTLRDYLEANPPAPGKLKSAAAPVSAPPQPQPAPDAAETPTKPSFRWPMPPQPAAVRFTPVPAAEPSDASSPIFETWPGTGAAPAPTPPPPA